MAVVVKAVCLPAYAYFERHMVNGARFSAREPNPLEGRRLAEFEGKLNK